MKATAHTIYRLKDGTRVPSVTAIVGLLDKSKFLVPWANNLGLEGIDVKKYVDNLAEVGTLAHKMILDYFKKQETDFTEYSEEVRDKAENSFLSFLAWVETHKIEPIFVEKSLVCEILRYGGTFDFYGIVDGLKTLIDFKTGSGIYEEYAYQLAAYKQMLFLTDGKYEVEQSMIVRIPRTEDEKFEVKVWMNLDKEFRIFEDLLDIYWIKKSIKNEEQ